MGCAHRGDHHQCDRAAAQDRGEQQRQPTAEQRRDCGCGDTKHHPTQGGGQDHPGDRERDIVGCDHKDADQPGQAEDPRTEGFCAQQPPHVTPMRSIEADPAQFRCRTRYRPSGVSRHDFVLGLSVVYLVGLLPLLANRSLSKLDDMQT